MIRTALLAFALAAAAATSATGATVYVARTGGGGACTYAAPCATMATALPLAGANGEVICLDRGNYGGASTTHAVTISCGDGLWEASTAAILINPPAGADVVIEGLVTDSNGAPGNTVVVDGAGTLHLHRVRIGNTPGASSNGIIFRPNGGGTLHVSDSVFYNNGGAGILVRPTGSGYANVHVRNVKFERNGNGIFADGSGSTVGINVNVTASVFAENLGNGIGAFSTAGQAGITVSVKDSQITGNLTNGLGALGAAASGAGSATIEIGSSMISANVNGLAASGAGQIRTFGNNQLRLNGNNGAFTGSVGLQ
jgi:hypothetical protein